MTELTIGTVIGNGTMSYNELYNQTVTLINS